MAASSSSSRAPPPDRGRPIDSAELRPSKKAKLEAPEQPGIYLRPVADEGIFFLNKPYGQEKTFAINTTTLQKTELPPGRWFTVFSEDGFAAVSTADGAQAVIVQDLFSKVLLQSETNEFFVEEKGRPRPWRLDSRRSMCEEIEVEFDVSVLRMTHKHKVYNLHWPRGGMNFFWDALALYPCLLMKGYGGKRTIWLFMQKKVWWKHFSKLVGSEVHYTQGKRSTSVGDIDTLEGGGLESDAIRLPSGALSTYGILQVLVWGARASGHEGGGLKDDTSRKAAKCLLEGIVSIGCNQTTRPLVIKFWCFESWKPPWPLEEETAPDMQFEADSRGVRLSMIRAQVVLKGLEPWWNSFWAKADVVFGRADRVNLVDFLLLLPEVRKTKTFSVQLLWCIARSVEHNIYTSLSRGTVAGSGLMVRTTKLIDLVWNKQRLDQEIRKYMYSCKRLTAGVRNFSIATDKANIGGPSLQNSIIVLSDGLALVQPPQVVLVFIRSLVRRF